jgi:hypothetical protein
MAMAATLTVAGVVGAVSQGANLLSKAGTQAPAKLCKDCKGEGLVACDLCQGTGQIRWEGKYRHKDECPSCEGRGEAKVRCWSIGAWKSGTNLTAFENISAHLLLNAHDL